MSNVFTPLLTRKEGGEIFTALPGHFNSSGLLYNYYCGNAQVAVIMAVLSRTPMRVAWVGEDAYEDMAALNDPLMFPLGNGFIKNAQELLRYHNALWHAEGNPIKRTHFMLRGDDTRPAHGDPFRLPKEAAQSHKFPFNKDFYIVNITKKCYLDMSEYYAQRKWEDSTLLLEPLPLLTALWNNPKLRKAGNYVGPQSLSSVGSWAFDEIFVSDEDPTTVGILCRGYKKVSFCFCNN